MPADLSPLWISLKTATLATVITFFLGIAAAYWMLGYRGKGKSLIEGCFVAPLILPPTVVGFFLLMLFGKYGPLGQLLEQWGISVVFTWYGAAIAATVVAFPLMYRTALGAFEQVDTSLLQVARTLGASEATVFRRVMLPLAAPGIVAGAVLAFARALGEFGATLMLAGNIPGQTQTIPMAIYFDVEAGAMNEAWFWAIAIMCISLSGIVAVNGWQSARAKRVAKGSQGASGWVDRDDCDQGNGEGRSNSQSISNPPVIPTVRRPNAAGLLLDIEKTLSSFSLNVSLQTEPGATLGLLGGSGAGKSMILRCIAGTETPTRGRIVLNGRILFDAKRKINVPSRDRRIGLLVQNYALFPHMTVARNIAFGLPKRLSKSQVRHQVAAHLQAMQLAGMGDRYPQQLSGGQQQRVALARALASQPEALLLDEPFSALDTHLRSRLEQEMIEHLSHYQGVSLFVTHNLEEAYRVCQDLVVMDGGRAIAHGPKQNIFEHPPTFTVAQLTGCKNFSQAIRLAPSQIQATDWGINLTTLESIPPHLEHVGIRPHQIIFTDKLDQDNTFPCWLVRTSETPHRMTLFLKFETPLPHQQDYHLQAEVFKEKWLMLKDQPFPWQIRLEPLRLILMQADMT